MNTKNVIRKRTCHTCGVVFDGGPRAWYCPNCRVERRKSSDKNAKLNKRAGKNVKLGITTRLCQVCGKPFIMMSARQKYCKICAPKAIKAVDREQSRGWIKRAVEKYGASYVDERNAKKSKTRAVKISKQLATLNKNSSLSNLDSIVTAVEAAQLLKKPITYIHYLCKGSNGAKPILMHSEYRKSGHFWLVTKVGLSRACKNYRYGKKLNKNAINNVLSIGEAAKIWNVSPASIRNHCKGIAQPIFTNEECRQSGKAWLVTRAAMKRVYNNTKNR